MKYMFMAHVYLQLHLYDDAIKIYQQLADSGFAKSTYIVSQMAVAFHNLMGDYYLSSLIELARETPTEWLVTTKI